MKLHKGMQISVAVLGRYGPSQNFFAGLQSEKFSLDLDKSKFILIFNHSVIYLPTQLKENCPTG